LECLDTEVSILAKQSQRYQGEHNLKNRVRKPYEGATESMGKLTYAIVAAMCFCAPATSQGTLFDFDNAPLRSPLPIDLTVDGITVHFSATGQGFSIQRADSLGFTPSGFSGNCIYPSSINAADLLVGFSLWSTSTAKTIRSPAIWP
jgi:hypothetical protein